MSAFSAAVNQAMRKLAEDERTIFVGQSVAYDGAAIYGSLDGVPADRRLEMPVIEDFQLGFCIGLALQGKIPVCIYPRFDFVLLAMNQLVNHLDKLPAYGWSPQVILRTVVGQKRPLDAGPQHTQNYVLPFAQMLHRVDVIHLTHAEQVAPAYARALAGPHASLLVENPL